MSTINGLSGPKGRAQRLLLGAAACFVAMNAAAAGSAGRHPTAVPGGPIKNFTAKVAPLGLSSTPADYIVEVSGDPISVVETNRGSALNATEAEQTKSALIASQSGVARQAQALGGSVMASYQFAYNGIRVRMSPQAAAKLAGIPGVKSVHKARIYAQNNVHGVPLVGGPAVWGGIPGYRGENIKIGVIDTGIDYTHADFGGPGTVAAYQTALATDTEPADPALFGPAAPKVKGGTDLVGDDYDAAAATGSPKLIPHPDANPLDCNGHGTHVAGTSTGYGVLSSGGTFPGPYDANTVSDNSFLVGPGVAPKADLYSIRVFGCTGSTNVVVDAIEWATANKMNVINMSLGSSYGTGDINDPENVATRNAANTGMIIAVSSGNSGPIPYIVGGPSTGDRVISVAALDPTASFAGALVSYNGGSVQSIDANGIPVNGAALPVKVLYTGTPHDVAHISLGCDPAEYIAANVAGAIAVVKRGTCGRVARAIYGQQAGASAVLMINNADSLPPFEGPITSNPDTGAAYTVTIPFLGVASSKAAIFVAADGSTVALNDNNIANPGFETIASFSSGGPRAGRSALKPGVSAPGVSIASAGFGTGNSYEVLSGTSMAAPHTAGTGALVRQAHPSWKKSAYWDAAIINTADPGKVVGYVARNAGVGLIQAEPATKTDVVALGPSNIAALNFGFVELAGDYDSKLPATLVNLGAVPVTFDVSITNAAGRPHTATPSTTTLTVPAGGSAGLSVDLAIPVATAGNSTAFRDVAGLVTFTPVGGANNGVALRLPYYAVPQAISAVSTKLNGHALYRIGSATSTTSNSGAIPGNADWYAWGLRGTANKALGATNLAAVGVQAFTGQLYFAVSTFSPWSSPNAYEFDIYVDVDGNGTDDYVVFTDDIGLLTAGAFSGQYGVDVVDLRTGKGTILFLAEAPFNSSTMVLPVNISQLCVTGSPCLSAASPRITYHAASFSVTSAAQDAIPAKAKFNAFAPAISTGFYDTVAPGGSADEDVSFDPVEAALTPVLGLMIVSHDNIHNREAQLVPVN